jgi:hypothetical protein
MSQSLTIETPEEFLGPITYCIMQHPMMTRNGLTFEKRAILRWLDRNDSCPITRAPLTPSGLVSNRNLQFKIMQWKAQHQHSEKQDYECDDNPATVYAPSFLDTYHALLEQEVQSDLESQQQKDQTGSETTMTSLSYEEDMDAALAIIGS